MYSNNQIEIRHGLVNYIGAMLQSSEFEDNRAKKHNVVAILSEEAANLCKNENGEFDMFASKPILRLTTFILKERIELLKELPQEEHIENQIKSYEFIITKLNNVIENTRL